MNQPRYIQGFAVVRVDESSVKNELTDTEFVVDGKVMPCAGPPGVTVKEVVTTAEEARREVDRLNRLNADKGCKYYWQSTHVFPDGGSHGESDVNGSTDASRNAE